MFENISTVVTKVTKGCNLRCKYCYIEDKDTALSMTDETFRALVDRIIYDKKLVGDTSPVNIVLHGGEPTTIGKEKMSRFLQYSKVKFEANEIDYHFNIQSNLTLIDADFLEIFQKYGIEYIGASFDGFNGGSDLRSTKLTNTFFKDKLTLCASYGIKIGFLVVTSRKNSKLMPETYRLLAELGINQVKNNYVENVINDDLIELAGDEYFEDIILPDLEQFLESGEFKNDNLDMVLEKFIRYNLFTIPHIEYSGNCYIKFCGAGSNILEVEPNGDLFPCGRYSKSFEELKLGNVYKNEFLDLTKVSFVQEFAWHKAEQMQTLKCPECKAYPICDGGCMSFHYSKFRKWGIRTDLVCGHYRKMWEWLSLHRSEVFEIYLNKYTNSKRLHIPGKTHLKKTSFVHSLQKEWDFGYKKNILTVDKG